ncbi:MAG: helix-turn-helix transcriptional regulator [Alphaproteobacteria bacterium]|nr:helix-turn-helix transcriptional regulator [Alphaproteobacteria bacterium]
MVKFQQAALDQTFAALADPTRRAILVRLGEEPGLSVSALAQPFAMSLPGFMKHLDVLAAAGLLRRVKSGRTVLCHLSADPMRAAHEWLAAHERFWSESLDRLAILLEEEKEKDPCPPSLQPPRKPAPASPSAGATSRRPKKSSRPSPTR